ncbi:hypothetical protein [Myceligenerans pegani]|uniref:Holin n=1 Tax=Myceligenerans pegani TaxID=2776917 RepID=A0ABR9MSX9_9MICO|nr:hypothetical protein [Myceligenerans sp. TRM 65318]MBE1874488.1 hypothetical protein [Myceligenerans sp. TRM 65318]MBE3016759.1 hypothetical protein [Myceligenerans sp. TRM 65318]
MKHKIIRGISTLAATGLGGWAFSGGDAWVALAIWAVAVSTALGFLAIFIRMSQEKRRDLVDLFHGRGSENGHSNE